MIIPEPKLLKLLLKSCRVSIIAHNSVCNKLQSTEIYSGDKTNRATNRLPAIVVWPRAKWWLACTNTHTSTNASSDRSRAMPRFSRSSPDLL